MVEKEHFSTTIDKNIINYFRIKCKADKVNMNLVLEAFMREYIKDNYITEVTVRRKLKLSGGQ